MVDFGLAARGAWILGPLSDLPLPCKRKLGADTTALTEHRLPDFLKVVAFERGREFTAVGLLH